MRRVAVICGVTAAALGGGVLAAAQAATGVSGATTTTPTTTTPTTPTTTTPTVPTTPTPGMPALRATLDGCRSAIPSTARAATFSAAMPQRSGAVRMAMRFDLYMRRSASKAWKRVAVPKWGVWHTSRTGVAGFVFTKAVDNLVAPASYRAVVRYRWFAKGDAEPVATTQRTTPTCTQASPSPDLVVAKSAVEVVPGLTGLRYTVTVRNAGLVAAGRFTVLVYAGERKASSPISAAGLGPGQVRSVVVDGPACPASGRYTVVLDPDDGLTDVDRRVAPTARRCES